MPSQAVSSPTFGRKATVRNARLRAAFSGPSKSGKSFDSYVIARDLIDTLKANGCLRGNGEMMVIDSEEGRAEEQYGDIFNFYTHVLEDYAPEAYMDALQRAVKANYSCIVIDQISHEWEGRNGALEIHSAIQKASSSKNGFVAWAEMSPRHRRFIDEITRCPTHIICTMRSKVEWVLEDNDRGQKVPRKVGLAPIQRQGTEYEFDIFGTVDQNHVLKVETRGSLSKLIGDREFRPGRDVEDPGEVSMIGKLVGEWIAGRKDSDVSLASRDQVNEIQALGEKLGITTYERWNKFYEQWKVQSLNMMTPEIFEKMKKSMTTAITKREAQKQT
jgi:hypothetical protein